MEEEGGGGGEEEREDVTAADGENKEKDEDKLAITAQVFFPV